MTERCPDCNHPWRSHMGRNGGERCWYKRFDGQCPCRRKNPDVEAEDRLAAALWNRWMGREPPEPQMEHYPEGIGVSVANWPMDQRKCSGCGKSWPCPDAYPTTPQPRR